MNGRETGSRLVLLALGVVASALVAEVALRVASLALRPDAVPVPPFTSSRERGRVLCLGDSNTFGLGVERGQDFPSQLEARWAQAGHPPIDVVNLGWPGLNSGYVRRDFARLLRTFRPDVVLLLIGNNDFWTAPPPAAGGSSLASIVRSSRLYRLLYISRRAFDQEEVEILPNSEAETGPDSTVFSSGIWRYGGEDFEIGYRPEARPVDRASRDLAANLTAIIETARRHGVRIVLLTYPSWRKNYARANPIIRAITRSRETTLVDVTPAIRRACPPGPCDDYLFPDQHPKARAYRLVAEALVAELEQELLPEAPPPQ